jgi:hypothetical protein
VLLDKTRPEFPPQQAIPFLSEQIGYRILGRGTVFCLLAAYCLLILGAGFWLARKGKLAHLGFLGPAAGVVTASVFAILGARARHTVPPTVAFFQRVDTETGSDQVDVRGLMAVYHPDPFDDLPEVTRGGLFSPDMTGLLGEIRRMVWTDLDAWRWEGLRLPAGAHYAPFRQTLKLEAPMAATGAFGPDGFSGTLSGTLQGISDALLTAPSGENLAVRFDTSGHFAAGSADALAPAQYIAAGLLSDQPPVGLWATPAGGLAAIGSALPVSLGRPARCGLPRFRRRATGRLGSRAAARRHCTGLAGRPCPGAVAVLDLSEDAGRLRPVRIGFHQ